MIKITYPLFIATNTNHELLYVKIDSLNSEPLFYFNDDSVVKTGRTPQFYLNQLLEGHFWILTPEEVKEIDDNNKISKLKFPIYFKANFTEENAYFLMESQNDIFLIKRNGRKSKSILNFEDLSEHKIISREEAEKLVTKRAILKHWTENGTGVTNFLIKDLTLYEMAVFQNGDKDLVIVKESIDGHGGYYSLHCLTGYKDISGFWRVFDKLKKENTWPKYVISDSLKYDDKKGFVDCLYIEWLDENTANLIEFNGNKRPYQYLSSLKREFNNRNWVCTSEEHVKNYPIKRSYPKYIINPLGFIDCTYLELVSENEAYRVLFDKVRVNYSVSAIKSMIKDGHWVETTKEKAESFLKKEVFPIYFCSKDDRGFADNSLFIKFLDKNNYQIISKQGDILLSRAGDLIRERAVGNWREIPANVAEKELKQIQLKREEKIKELTQKLQTLSTEQLNNIKL